MKAFFTTLLAIVCVAVLILGNAHWDKKTTVRALEEVENKAQQKTNKIEEKQIHSEEEMNQLLSLASNWPQQSQDAFQEALIEGRSFHILFVGSKALESGNVSWPAKLQNVMEEAYGDSIFTFETITSDLTSMEYVNEKGYENWNSDADLILLEPFTLSDNGEVTIDDSIINIQTMMKNQKATIILQPPHPIYNATFYPLQVEALKEFATDNEITYLDHWTAWPNPSTVEMLGLLDEESNLPNEAGQELWASYLEEYFVNY